MKNRIKYLISKKHTFPTRQEARDFVKEFNNNFDKYEATIEDLGINYIWYSEGNYLRISECSHKKNSIGKQIAMSFNATPINRWAVNINPLPIYSLTEVKQTKTRQEARDFVKFRETIEDNKYEYKISKDPIEESSWLVYRKDLVKDSFYTRVLRKIKTLLGAKQWI